MIRSTVRDFRINIVRFCRFLKYYSLLKRSPGFDHIYYSKNARINFKSRNIAILHFLVAGYKANYNVNKYTKIRDLKSNYNNNLGTIVQCIKNGIYTEELNSSIGINPDYKGRVKNDHDRIDNTYIPEFMIDGNIAKRKESQSIRVNCYKKDLSIIIPTYNRENILKDLMESWSQVRIPKNYKVELLICNDGSTDNTLELLSQIKLDNIDLRIVDAIHGGASHARNEGIKKADGRRIYFLGDDIYPTEDLIEWHYHLDTPQNYNLAILGGVKWHEKLPVNHLMIHIVDIGQEQFSFSALENNSIVDYRHFYTCNLSVPTDYIRSEEKHFSLLFDKYGYEDIEFGKRLSEKGLQILYNEDCSLQHYHPYDVTKFLKRQHSAGSMAIKFKELHPDIDFPIGINSFDPIYPAAVYNQLNKIFYLLVDITEIYEKLLVLSEFDSLNLCTRYSLSKLYKALFFIEYQKGQLDQSGQDPLLALNIIGCYYDIYDIEDAKFKTSRLQAALFKLCSILKSYEATNRISMVNFQALSLTILSPFLKSSK